MWATGKKNLINFKACRNLFSNSFIGSMYTDANLSLIIFTTYQYLSLINTGTGRARGSV
jgi:hypothetical protein